MSVGFNEFSFRWCKKKFQNLPADPDPQPQNVDNCQHVGIQFPVISRPAWDCQLFPAQKTMPRTYHQSTQEALDSSWWQAQTKTKLTYRLAETTSYPFFVLVPVSVEHSSLLYLSNWNSNMIIYIVLWDRGNNIIAQRNHWKTTDNPQKIIDHSPHAHNWLSSRNRYRWLSFFVWDC